MRKLRIAQIAPIAERVPPKKYGGTERVVHALTEELIRRGHDVTLFASGDSVTSAQLSAVAPRALREENIRDIYGANETTLLHTGAAYKRQFQFDVIHDHLAPLSLPTAQLATTPVVMTMHGALNPQNRALFKHLQRPHIVSISEAQIHGDLDINHLGTVYNGLEMEHFPFGEKSEDFLLVVGRVSAEKGTHIAVEVARALDMRLIIAAKVDDVDRPYFEEKVKPYLSDKIELIGEVTEDERNDLMSRAYCFLHPVTWKEPFGLVLIEAMACGCPVVAFDLGSIPEVVRSGSTGFVVRNTEEMIVAVKNIKNISRKDCREYVLSRFGVSQMADGYEKIYAQVVDAHEVPYTTNNTYEFLGSRGEQHKRT